MQYCNALLLTYYINVVQLVMVRQIRTECVVPNVRMCLKFISTWFLNDNFMCVSITEE